MSENCTTSRISDWRCTSHGISNLLQHVLASGQISDVKFAVGHEHGTVRVFSAHKFILSLNSDVFDAMFNGELAESATEPIKIPEILPEAFAVMLQYMYSGSTERHLQTENLFQTIYCADKYNLPMLLEACLKFARSQLKIDNCLMFLDYVNRFMHNAATGVFVEKRLAMVDASATTIFQSDEFAAIGQDTLTMLLQRDTLLADEHTIYTAVERWAAETCRRNKLEVSGVNRRKMLGIAVFHVRFPLLTDSQLASGPVKNGLLLESEVVALYQYKHTMPNRLCPFLLSHEKD
ncbi:BTB/POZ domain-containing protein 2-like isoform X1 [Paramacrobiotus metropolitanus]|uniref:BTB/POZ domain-containing protein 2-like isoform X1 n=1 Tax=Paramacrobiotus metropolitanus TaxID=2943436 RepID=UPI0024458282|nr:BTB/POZ domain-containing protein 2-like isoform X1 [Paramacrobiotus metropolitanus]XP_055350913.1 BTB/POZ domain-containing protein 2-like isoform X1 [Paramacrobiotus metropolitanus]XP_055350914.1 BTB/POZ domain-containing protein 2-like isoform X1 [Paramacrobiotus metropolitanus]